MNSYHLHIHNRRITKMRQSRNESNSEFHRMPSSLFPVKALPLQWHKSVGRPSEGRSWFVITQLTPREGHTLFGSGAWTLIKLFSPENSLGSSPELRENQSGAWDRINGQSLCVTHPSQYCQSKCQGLERGTIEMVNGLEIDGFKLFVLKTHKLSVIPIFFLLQQ